jgi:putative transposase
MHGALMNGSKVRILNIIYDYNRQVLAMDVDYSHSGMCVCRAFERLLTEHGFPAELLSDNGPELLSGTYTDFSGKYQIKAGTSNLESLSKTAL